MKRFLSRVGRFFGSWGFLKFTLWTITLIVLFYVEEDWRGARMWAATKAEWEAKGETFDGNKFIPPPIPDDQNLGAIPLFKLELDPALKTSSILFPIVLRQAIRENAGSPDAKIPKWGSWQQGELPDMEQIGRTISTEYAVAFPGKEPPKDPLTQFEELYSFLPDLRAAVEARPLCRFSEDYTSSPPFARNRMLLMGQLKLSKILTLHAILALDEHQSDLAMADLKATFKLISGVRRDSTLFAGLLAIAMISVSDVAIYDGMFLHAWSDAQLATIQEMLEPINFLADYQFERRSETAGMVATIDVVKDKQRSSIVPFVGMGGTPRTPSVDSFLGYLWPDGWLDRNKSQLTTFHFQSLPSVDPKSHRVFPEIANQLENQVEHLENRWDGYAPWNILFTASASGLTSLPMKFAQGQFLIDETRIACGLERYRLAHGAYPDSLDALAPAYIPALPHDIVSGDSYHYRVQPDGTFLLYSVGWNQKDDGGKIIHEYGDPTNIPDLKQGDWVWPAIKKS